jgi:citrate lyase beta subunit
MEKAVNYGANVLVLDLEDSVPNQEKVAARAMLDSCKIQVQRIGTKRFWFETRDRY